MGALQRFRRTEATVLDKMSTVRWELLASIVRVPALFAAILIFLTTIVVIAHAQMPQNNSARGLTPRTFQALQGGQEIIMLGIDGNLWLEEAPFGQVPPKRQQVDSHVWTFQAVDANSVFVLGSDGKLWLEHAPFGKVSPRRE
jgi:hypothetical protein